MKLVLDSNIIVAAYAGRGLCNSLFELCLDRYSIIISDFILAEVYRTLNNKLKMPPKNVQIIIDYLKEFCDLTAYTKLNESICRDKNDNDIIALAISNNVDYLITGDKDLLILKKYKKVKIISPREFWLIVKGNNQRQ
ncbi:MAG: putative toxin-antitoxin system toxin component, PIN family [Spirochaetes bacterium RBG_13_51_14]|nr:MAG: putative toxin-antitoxin system toxin component, PIN family [Spirochaetes bacterium RBG_13_51_14]